MNTIITIPAFGDNLIYLCQYKQNDAFVVDPSDSSSVLSTMKKHGLSLNTILVTHHHWDHIAGVVELKKKTGCKVIGGDEHRIPGIDRIVEDGQILAIDNARIQVIATPGHTRTAVCYYMLPSNDNENGILWTGDTLFVGGCGRLLESDVQSMWDSLLKLASLPDDTLVYCGHDYTVENYEFALSIEPGNQAVTRQLSEVKQALKAGRQSVPSTILRERKTNTFLRTGTLEVKNAVNMPQAQPVEVFAELRRRKDIF
ncbi:MAG: hydroxyacylglutathione hydrolase [Planctomycetota bacterium]|jgi:hydroxyacylglutathione hydrolase